MDMKKVSLEKRPELQTVEISLRPLDSYETYNVMLVATK